MDRSLNNFRPAEYHIEVSRQWRRCCVASRLLAFAFPLLEDYIVITLEYCWHRDLTGSGLETWEYRKILTALFGKTGMVGQDTDDPDIMEHPANVLMARVGERVPLWDAASF